MYVGEKNEYLLDSFGFCIRKNRGFGFITRKSDGADFFVHARSINKSDLDSLTEGIEVDFIEIENDRGSEAKDIRILNKINS
jgi:CspA family cold shock protein